MDNIDVKVTLKGFTVQGQVEHIRAQALTLLCLTLLMSSANFLRVFKRATPRLNVMICLGTIVGFSSSFLYSMVLNFYRDLPYTKGTKTDLTGILFVCNVS